MEAFSVIRASAFRALKPVLFDKIVPLELATRVKEQYGFISAPGVNLLSQPADFQAGKFMYGGKSTSIEQLFVAYVGNRATSIGASTRISTDASEAFLQELTDWIGKEFELDTNEILPRAYFSQVEFVLPKSLSQHFAALQRIGEGIATFVKGYGLENCPLYEYDGFSMNFDVVKFEDLKPMPQPFAIARRVGSKYEENKYFSQAPLRTQDHRVILEQVEQILLR
jgi:hypothetical protein